MYEVDKQDQLRTEVGCWPEGPPGEQQSVVAIMVPLRIDGGTVYKGGAVRWHASASETGAPCRAGGLGLSAITWAATSRVRRSA